MTPGQASAGPSPTAPAQARRVADVADATPLDALLLEEMPLEAHFRRDHFPAPEVRAGDWALEVTGAVHRPLRLDVAGLRALGRRTESVVLECAGHRRSEYSPPAPGLAWAEGAVSEARWTGAPLAALLEHAGVLPGASSVALEGADCGPFHGRDGSHRFARALPLAKALATETVLVWEVNGQPIPARRGGPVRAIVPGWYATDSVKWLTRITLLQTEFTGPWEADDYRYRAAGETGRGARMTALPIHALVVEPGARSSVRPGDATVRGVVWGGDGGVDRVEIRIDGGPWHAAELGASRGAFARRFWAAAWHATPGEHRVEVRATDAAGQSQPEAVRWNPGGYANNAVHGVTFTVQAPSAAPAARSAA
jgi:sulfane dehydrogenase subunit SoxC